MATKILHTPNYGDLTVKDVIIDVDGTNLIDGVDVFDEDGKLLIEIAYESVYDINNPNELENFINDFNVE